MKLGSLPCSPLHISYGKGDNSSAIQLFFFFLKGLNIHNKHNKYHANAKSDMLANEI